MSSQGGSDGLDNYPEIGNDVFDKTTSIPKEGTKMTVALFGMSEMWEGYLRGLLSGSCLTLIACCVYQMKKAA